MARTLICTLLLLAWNATAWAQILDARELNTDQIARLDRARTVVLLTAGILEEHGPFLPSYSDGYQRDSIATRVAEAVAGRSRGRSFGSRTFHSAHFRPATSDGSMSFPEVTRSAWRRCERSSWIWRLISAKRGSGGWSL
jgi:creatinine amidohydrolase/Fe(II)-dependent formamide hydrolase-like protein